jgi:Uma2 family endonuclease
MSSLQAQPLTDTCAALPWEKYLQLIEDPAYEKAKSYYYRGHMRVEISPVGFDHSTDHSIIAFAINLFAVIRGIPLTMADNCTYRRCTGVPT